MLVMDSAVTKHSRRLNHRQISFEIPSQYGATQGKKREREIGNRDLDS